MRDKHNTDGFFFWYCHHKSQKRIKAPKPRGFDTTAYIYKNYPTGSS